VNSKSICQIFNVELGFFKHLDATHELLEVPYIKAMPDSKSICNKGLSRDLALLLNGPFDIVKLNLKIP